MKKKPSNRVLAHLGPSVAFLAVFLVGSLPALGQDLILDDFDSDLSPSNWIVYQSHGTGTLTWVPGAGRNGSGAGELSYSFVADDPRQFSVVMQWAQPLPLVQGSIEGVSFWIKNYPLGGRIAVEFVDGVGER